MEKPSRRRRSNASDMTTGPEVRVAAVVDADEDPAGGARSDEESRSARKRRAITEAATTLFLRNGYQGTSMDEVAALAAVSKQTVYKNFADKEQLFSDIVLGITGNADRFAQVATTLLQDTDDLEKDLRELARRYLTSVLQPQVLQLRRLVIGEAARFPELGRAYYARAPERVLATLASLLQDLADRGLLRLDDPLLAARHLAFLILSIPLDKAMFCGDEESFTAAELERFADAGVGVFLAAYGAPLKAIS
jgi:TetR/AcrR family transcriptional regulator, mexJK operon transcriptional repressor